MGSLIRRRRKDGSLHSKWTIVYEDANGKRRFEVAYRDKRSSAQLLAQREKETALRLGGMWNEAAEQNKRPLGEHLEDFLVHVRSRGTTGKHQATAESRLRKAFDGMRATRLSDITQTSAETYLVSLIDHHGLSAKTRDEYLALLRQFFEWCVDLERVQFNPVRRIRRIVTPATRDAHRVYERRPLTSDELERLVGAALVRGAQQYAATHSTKEGPRVEQLRRIGRERGMVYAFAGFTGLRQAACRAVRWGDLDLDGDDPSLRLEGRYAKNRRTLRVPVISWLAAELRDWRGTKSEWLGRPVRDSEPVFTVPSHIVRRLQDDARWAGIELVNELGQRVDFHSLRATTATLCVLHGVHPRRAMQILGHSTIAQTMEVYAKLSDDDLREAVEQLPQMEGLRGLASDSSVPTDLPTLGGRKRATGGNDRPRLKQPQTPRKASGGGL